MRLILIICYCLLLIPAFSQDANQVYKEGLELKKNKQTALAIEKFLKAVELKPNFYEAAYELGWCYNDTKSYSQALIYLKKASIGMSKVAKVFFETGYTFEKLSLFDSAKLNYAACLKINSGYSLAFKQLGYIEYEQGNYIVALEQFALYETNAKDSIADFLYWYKKGFCFNATKKYQEAKHPLLKSLTLRFNYINTYLELGFAYTKLKQDDSAIFFFKKGIEIDPKSHIPYNGIAEVYRDNKKNMAEAISWYNKTLAVKADERKACFGLGYCLNSLGRYPEAIPYLSKAIEKEPAYTAAYVELGYSYYRSNRLDDALVQFDKAIKLSASNENARYYAGLVYISKKDKANAQKMVAELKQLGSKNAPLLEEKVNKI